MFFLFVFFGLRRELANCESNLILLPENMLWLPGKTPCYQDDILLSDQYCIPNSQIPPAHSYLLFRTRFQSSWLLFIRSMSNVFIVLDPGYYMFNINLAFNIIGLYLFFINYKELSVD